MPKYAVEIIPKAEKEFLKLPERLKDSISRKILTLEDNPRPFGSKKLKETDYYRIRIGDFRVIYRIHDPAKLVKVLSIAHRKEVYR
jgi:mRNA interferase RelE/StbE